MARPDGASDVWVWRGRLLAVCLGLAGIAFRQAPGLVATDTKVDLTANPWGLLARALHLWDPHGALGQLQNQAYGYLFPMGPFHGILRSLGVAPWVVSRLWWSLLLCVAFLGVHRLAGAMAPDSNRWLRVVAGVAYALSPRIASELTVTSVEVWPMALAPWVLSPLVDPRPRSWWWRTSRSALAYALCGGVNAVASGAVLVLPALWFLTRRAGRGILPAFLGWLAAVVAAMGWWLGPLLVLGRYSPPFLDWIESAAVTTSTASPFEAVRGTSAWLAFLATPLGPDWPGGWSYASNPAVVVATSVLAALGLLGLAAWRSAERTFLLGAVLVGVVLLTAGHVGALSGLGAGALRDLLDGPLAAFRNAHKFDLVLRLPLALGLVGAGEAGRSMVRRLGLPGWAAPTVVVSVLVAATAPSLAASLPRDQAYASIPAYWREAAAWLDAQPGRQAVLSLPATSFADFAWGSTKDDPLQAILRRPSVLRDAVPLGSAGGTRMLDGLVRDLATGTGNASVRRTLAAAGIGYVLVRNDLRPEALGDPRLLVTASLEASGLSRVAQFGPQSANLGDTEGETVDYRTQVPRPMLEVYAVPGAVDARMEPLDSVVRAAAGPEDLSRLIGAARDHLFLLGSDGGAGAAVDVLTDGLRRREVNFGAASHNTSEVLTAGEQPRQQRRAVDYLSDAGAAMTVTAWSGIAGVRASSSASDVTSTLHTGPENRPGAALDGDPTTRWLSGRPGHALGEWLQVDLERAAEVPGVRLTLSDAAPVSGRPTRLLVRTERGDVSVPVGPVLGPLTVRLPQGATRWVRVSLEDAEGPAPSGFAVAELELEGTPVREVLVVPRAEAPRTVVLGRDDAGRTGCVRVGGFSHCSPTLAAAPGGPEVLARRLRLGRAGEWGMSGRVDAVANARTDALLDFGGRLTASASSRLVDSPVDRPGAALDRDLTTGWVAGPRDFGPVFTIDLPEARRVSGVQFLRDPRLAASAPKVVDVMVDDHAAVPVVVDDSGTATFPEVSARRVRLRFGATRPLVDVDSRTGTRSYVPVGFSEVRLLGADDLREPLPLAAPTGAPCGLGPTLEANGVRHPTEVSGSVADLAFGRPLLWRTCEDPVRLSGQDDEVVARPSVEFVPRSMTLREVGSAPTASRAEPLAVSPDGPAAMGIALPARESESVVAVGTNHNPGWVATLDGRALRPLRVNGWQQGWVVPPGPEGRLVARFAPDRDYRAALGAGALALLLLLGAARVARGRRLPPPPALRAGPAVSLLVPAVAAALLGGAGWALGVVVLGGLLAFAARPGRRPLAAVAGAGLVLLAGVVVAASGDPGRAGIDSWPVQALVVAGVLACSVSGLLATVDGPGSDRRPRSRTGRSRRR